MTNLTDYAISKFNKFVLQENVLYLLQLYNFLRVDFILNFANDPIVMGYTRDKYISYGRSK